ncbi:MAG: helix-turn-helix transcriptional regulator [bacterium]|nr:helix-turn-helix transcriptional regulator [bacterium]
MNIGKRLYRIRKKNNLTLENVSDMFLNLVSAQTLSKYEKGRTPDSDFLVAFLMEFKLSAEWLLLGHGPIYREKKDFNKTIADTFLELIAMIDSQSFEATEGTPVNKVSPEKFAEENPEDSLEVLTYMQKDTEVRKSILVLFHLILKPQAIKRINQQASSKKGG